MGYLALRGNGSAAWSGWPSSMCVEALRDRCFRHDTAARAARALSSSASPLRARPSFRPGAGKRTAYRTGLTGLPRHL